MPSLRRLAPAVLLVLFAAAAGPALPSEPPKSGSEILTSLFRNISTDDFDYDAGERLADLEQALDKLRAAAEEPGPASCDRYCDARSPVLEKSCSTLLQPVAARSRALCHARVLDMRAQCRAACRS